MYSEENCRLRVGKETLNRPKLKSCLKPAKPGVGSKPNDNMHSKKNDKIRCIPWTCPPKFAIDCDWQVAAGEESHEVKSQTYREVRELEALYPRPSSIPPNPYVLKDAYDGHVDESPVPEIPLKGIEEEEEDSCITAPSEASMQVQALDLPADFKPDITAVPGIDADIAAAARGVYNAIMKWNIINILKTPELVKKLVEHGLSDIVKEPVDMVEEVIPPTPDVGPKKSCDVISVASTSTGSPPVSTLTQVNSTVPLQNSNTDKDDGKSCEPSGSSSESTSTTGSLPVSSCVLPVTTSVEMKVVNSGSSSASTSTAGSLPVSSCVLPVTTSMEMKVVNSGSSSASTTESLPVSSCVLPVTTSTEMKVVNGETGEPSNSDSEPLSNMVKETNEASQPDCAGNAPFSWTPSVPFKMSESNEMVINSVMNKLRAKCPSSQSSTQIPDSSLHLGPSSLYLVPHNVPQPAPSMAITTPPTKDMVYYKGLVREHGNAQENSKTSYVKPRCKFLGTPGGCRNGDKCRFDHAVENLPNGGMLLQNGPESKKMKLSGEVGTMK